MAQMDGMRIPTRRLVLFSEKSPLSDEVLLDWATSLAVEPTYGLTLSLAHEYGTF